MCNTANNNFNQQKAYENKLELMLTYKKLFVLFGSTCLTL